MLSILIASPKQASMRAAGIHRRKLGHESYSSILDVAHHRFNEAAGIHRRKPATTVAAEQSLASGSLASMRPPEFTGGNRLLTGVCSINAAPNRGFNEAAGIHRRKHVHRGRAQQSSDADQLASMRPPEFTGGNSAGGGCIAMTAGRGSLQ